MKRDIIIEGSKFNRLTIIKEVEPKTYKTTPTKNRMVLCLCECGEKISTMYSQVKLGHSKSCGCYAREMAAKRLFKHGLSNTKFQDTYFKLRARCNNKQDPDYYLYGGRGIKCAWKTFEDFKKDMYPSFLKHQKKNNNTNTRIDRIDNNGNYCKENCRWATHKEQARNRRSNHLITYNGETLTSVEWSERLGGEPHLVLSRINNYGWTPEEAVTIPVLKGGITRKTRI